MTTSIAAPVSFRRTLRRVPTPVAFLGAMGDRPLGMLVGSFVGISFDPPLVGVFLQKTSTTWPRLRSALEGGAELGISILGRPHEREIRRLAGPQRFSDGWVARSGGAIHLEGADTELTARLGEVQEMGDHFFALLRVTEVTGGEDTEALVFHESKVANLGDVELGEL